MTVKSVISRIVMNQTLLVQQHLAWNKDTQRWKVSSMLPSDLCNQYKIGPKITGMKGS